MTTADPTSTNNLTGTENQLKDEEEEEEFNLLMEVGYQPESESNENVVSGAGADIILLNDNLKPLGSTSTIYNITNNDDVQSNKNIKIYVPSTADEVKLVQHLNIDEDEQNNQIISEINEEIFYEEYQQNEDIFENEDDDNNDYNDGNNNDVEINNCEEIEYIEESLLIEEDENNINGENNLTSNIQIEIINNINNNSDAEVNEEEEGEEEEEEEKEEEEDDEDKSNIYTEQVFIIEDKEDENNIRELSTTKVMRHKKNKNPVSTTHYCMKCNKDFSTKTNLMRHMQTHDGSKPYQCIICGKSFTQNGSLKQHMRIHTGERPFQCTECNRGFTQGKSLTFHMRRHTGEKPFTCSACGLMFRQRDGLKVIYDIIFLWTRRYYYLLLFSRTQTN